MKMQLYGEILKPSQSPNLKSIKFNFIFWNPFKTRAESRDTDISARSWTWALPEPPRAPRRPGQCNCEHSWVHMNGPFQQLSSEHQKEEDRNTENFHESKQTFMSSNTYKPGKPTPGVSPHWGKSPSGGSAGWSVVWPTLPRAPHFPANIQQDSRRRRSKSEEKWGGGGVNQKNQELLCNQICSYASQTA